MDAVQASPGKKLGKLICKVVQYMKAWQACVQPDA